MAAVFAFGKRGANNSAPGNQGKFPGEWGSQGFENMI